MRICAALCWCEIAFVLLICQPAALKSVENHAATQAHLRSQRQVTKTIVYPKDGDAPSDQVLNRGGLTTSPILSPTPCPNNEQFCETEDDYPKDHVKNLLSKKLPKFITNQFFVDEGLEDDDDQADRLGEQSQPLCTSSVRYLHPTKGKSTEGTLEFIVNYNSDGNYQQRVRVEICQKNSSCDIPGVLNPGYYSFCEDKLMTKALVVINKNTSDPEPFLTKPFQFPVACCCSVYSSSHG